MPLKYGSLVDERYRVNTRIGHGGMAEVYEATDIITRKSVAIKLIKEDLINSQINLKRFQNEASIAASLNHPNLVKVYNHGTVGGIPYIIYEYVKGQTLSEVLDFRGALPINEAVDIMIQLFSALAYAHAHNIVHRDIKPQNIFYLPDGTVKIGDFGIAEAVDRDTIKNKSTDIIGSVHYLAPELSNGKPASALSDIYAAGCTFFELITSHVPFTGDNPVNIAVSHIRDKFPSPKKYIPSCPKEIERIIFKCTNKKLSQRYQSAQEVLDDLNELKKNPLILKEKKNFLARLFGFK